MQVIGQAEIDKRYECIKLIKSNAKSRVYLVRDKVLGRELVVKRVKRSYGNKINDLGAEADIMVGLDHPNLPKIIDVKEDDTYFYVIEEFVDGENFKTILDNEGPVPQDNVIDYMITLCDVLSYLHKQGIIYRDMKPSNLMLNKAGAIRLIDFDTARRYKEGQENDTDALGTEGYAAPEQHAKVQAQSDARTDIYGLGATMFHLLTGRSPASYEGSVFSIRSVNQELSSGLDRIILKCTERAPEKRYQTIEELKNALLNYEKYDYKYVLKRRKILKKFYILAGISMICLLISLGLGITKRIMDSNDYERLLAGSPTQEEMEKAISVKPGEEKAYLALLDSFGESLSQEELTIFSRNYSLGKSSMSSKTLTSVSMAAGEKILAGYEEESDRAKLIMSEPYFIEVRDNGSEKYEKYHAALLYCNMASFYKDYIMQENSMLIKEAGKEEHEALISDMKASIEMVSKYEGQESKNLSLSLYSIILTLMQNESNLCFEEDIKKEELMSVVNAIEEKVNEISSEVEVLNIKKGKVLDMCKETTKKIDSAYSKHKEGK